MYELFSVVIHSGSTHSGHYTAYIRDIDELGTWASPVSQPKFSFGGFIFLTMLGSTCWYSKSIIVQGMPI